MNSCFFWWIIGFIVTLQQLFLCPSAPSYPHFEDCVSSDQMTFRCWWSPGDLQNLSSPGSLRVFYRYRKRDRCGFQLTMLNLKPNYLMRGSNWLLIEP